MGQYHMIINADKKEYLYSNSGLKLLEWDYLKNPMNLTLLYKLSHDWKNDRVYVVGDYATSKDVYNYECAKVLKDLEKEFDTDNIYFYAGDKFKQVSLKEDLVIDDYKYIYNHDTNQYLDLTHCVPGDCQYDFMKLKNKVDFLAIAPLPLMLALGNGLGGGDYPKGCHNYELVGSWINNIKSLEVRKNKLKNDYEELIPEFQEGKIYMSYKQAEKIKNIIEKKYIDFIKEDSWINRDFIEKIINGKDPTINIKKEHSMER